MFPAQNTTYVSEGLARFTSAYTATLAPKLQALATCYLQSCQLMETALFQVIQNKWLVNAVGIDLDILGDIVGQERLGLSDTLYRQVIRLRIRANRSNGRSDDVVGLGLLIAQELTTDLNGVVKYLESATAAFDITFTNLAYPQTTWSLLQEARAAGTRGEVIYSIWPDGNDFEWADVNNLSTTGQGTWGDSVAGLVGGLLLSAQPI
jgi:hypothetical protein